MFFFGAIQSRKYNPNITPPVPSGKRLHNYGKIHHFSWVNPLFLWPFSIAFSVSLPGRVINIYIYIYTCIHTFHPLPHQIRGQASWLTSGTPTALITAVPAFLRLGRKLFFSGAVSGTWNPWLLDILLL